MSEFRLASNSIRAVTGSEGKKAVPRGDGDVLFAIHLVAHGPRDDLASEGHLPEQRAAACIQRLEVAFATTNEEQVRGGGQNSAGVDVVHLKGPLLLSSLRIESDHRAMSERLGVGVDGTLPGARGIVGARNGAGVCAAGVAQAFLVLDVYPAEDRRV